MRKIRIANQTIDMVFLLVLFCVFTATMVTVLITGAQSYQAVTEKMDGQYTERTCLAYVDAKLRHYDEAGAICLEQFENHDAIVFKEEVGQESYRTMIYYHDGYVRELYCQEGLEFRPEDGEIVIEASGLSAAWKKNHLLEVECINKTGRAERLLYYCRAAGLGADVIG